MTLLLVLGFLGFVAYLFGRDVESDGKFSTALWVPLTWMFLAGSRWASSWLSMGEPLDTVNAYSEGSPVDRAVFFGLIAAGLVTLARRKIDWGSITRNNCLLASYFLYCLLSTFWSDEPFIAFKRWFKDLGNPIMVLVILTEPRPLQALTQMFRRLAYLLLPASVLFVKYLPEYGRVYHYDGSPMYTGIGHQKNDLGLMCLVTGIYFFWQIMQARDRFLRWSRGEQWRLYLLVAMMAWLLRMSNSQTALSCLLVVLAVLLVGRLPFVRSVPSRAMVILVTGGLVLGALEVAFDLRSQILELLGRDPSLTNRTQLWSVVLSLQTQPEFGFGFMSFWTGARMEAVWRAMHAIVNQAHSGYLEQYLNLGYVGLGFIVTLMLRGLVRAWGQLDHDPSMAMLRICLILAAALYNYTEASFYGINNMWILLLTALTHVPQRQSAGEASSTISGSRVRVSSVEARVRSES